MSIPTPPPAPPVPPVPTPPPAPSAPPPAPAAPPVPPTPTAPPVPPVDPGFPAGVPLEQMTTEQQVAYWKHYSRQHEATAKSRADYDVIKAKAEQFDKFQAENATEHEKAVQAAAKAARVKALEEVTPRIVRAEFRVATAGRVTDEQLDTVLGPLDLRWFLDTAGNVDTAKVATYAASIAPGPTPFPNLGQGNRPGGVGPSVAAGRAMFEAQKKPAPTS